MESGPGDAQVGAPAGRGLGDEDEKHAKFRGTTALTYFRRDAAWNWKQYVLKAGGHVTEGGELKPRYFGDQVEQIELTAADPRWQTLNAMNKPRDNFYVVPLPDGRILAVGGNEPVEPPDPANYDHFDRNEFLDVLEAEMYHTDRVPAIWELMATLDAAAPRRMRSAVLLLPDARVLALGGQYRDGPSGPLTHMTNGQVYSPPYLFNSDGSAATRPVISSAPGTIFHNQGFDVDTPDAEDVTKVSLIRLGAATHSFDHDTRYLPLKITLVSTTSLRVVAPPTGHIAPPGYYMLFILKPGNNPPYEVPSDAKIVKLVSGPGGSE